MIFKWCTLWSTDDSCFDCTALACNAIHEALLCIDSYCSRFGSESGTHGPLLKTELWSCLVMTVYHFKVQGGGTGIPRVPPGAEKINMTHVNVVQNGSIET